MSDRIATRRLVHDGVECLLFVERPLEDEDGACTTGVGLVEGSRECWSLQVCGDDGLQSLLLALRLTKTLLKADSGFTFLGVTILCCRIMRMRIKRPSTMEEARGNPVRPRNECKDRKAEADRGCFARVRA